MRLEPAYPWQPLYCKPIRPKVAQALGLVYDAPTRSPWTDTEMLKKILLILAIVALAIISLKLIGSVFTLAFVLIRVAAGVGLVVLIVWLIKTQLRSPPRSRF